MFIFMPTIYCCDSKRDSLSFSFVHSYLSSTKQAGTLTFSIRHNTHSLHLGVINWHRDLVGIGRSKTGMPLMLFFVKRTASHRGGVLSAFRVLPKIHTSKDRK